MPGGSGGATFQYGLTVNGTLNAGSGGITLGSMTSPTTVLGSTSGSATFYQSFSGSNIKEVIIYCNALIGTATFTFPYGFTHTPQLVTTNGPASSVVTTLSPSGVTLTGAPTTGYIKLIGN